MAVHYRTQGFVLKKENLREADQLFTVYTKDFGKLKISGKAIRKIKSKLRGSLRFPCLSEVEFIQGKTYKTLTDTILIENFPGIRKDLRKLRIIYQIADILDNLIKGQELDEKIWNLLNEVLNQLNNLKLEARDWELEIIYYYWLWNFLSVLGYQPELYNCSLCQKKLKPEKLFWSPREGGVICNNCFEKLKNGFFSIDPNTIKVLRLILKKEYSVLKKLKTGKANQKKLEAVSTNFLSYISSQIS